MAVDELRQLIDLPIDNVPGVLWGFLIPIINTMFIELSTTAYLITLFSLLSSQDSTSWITSPRATEIKPSPLSVTDAEEN
jgi:hypothetical protein